MIYAPEGVMLTPLWNEPELRAQLADSLAKLAAEVRALTLTWAVGFVPVPAVLGVAACLALLVSFDPHVYAAGGIALTLAVLVVATRRWWKR